MFNPIDLHHDDIKLIAVTRCGRGIREDKLPFRRSFTFARSSDSRLSLLAAFEFLSA